MEYHLLSIFITISTSKVMLYCSGIARWYIWKHEATTTVLDQACSRICWGLPEPRNELAPNIAFAVWFVPLKGARSLMFWTQVTSINQQGFGLHHPIVLQSESIHPLTSRPCSQVCRLQSLNSQLLSLEIERHWKEIVNINLEKDICCIISTDSTFILSS